MPSVRMFVFAYDDVKMIAQQSLEKENDNNSVKCFVHLRSLGCLVVKQRAF